MVDLLERWRAAARGAGAKPGTGWSRAGERLLDRWREPHRHYHTVAHLTAVLDVVDEHAGLADRADLVRLAAWWHDAVYDPRTTGDANERDSAALAESVLTGLGVPVPTAAEVRRLVLLTAGHVVDPDDRDGALLCDADLAVLAAPPAAYDRYAAAVRREYAHVPEPAFRAGRAAVLEALLAQPALFRLPPLAARWAESARGNVRRELAALTAAEPPTEAG
ncbi:metal-dependent phosphohydrolase [Micromonospora sp. NPDC049044]|uniref:HD domain-containing protein n=1 Tax=unclassified Micromonospora TaxID=2617518 RepID=UPI0033F1F5C7